VIFSDKSYPDLAHRIHDLLGSPTAFHEMLDAQRQRAIEIIRTMDGGSFLELLAGPVSS
jgi:hypothetical protein